MSGFAVVDVETTGLFPGGHDRVIEIGVVQLTADGRREATWGTLLNPGRDLGPQSLHGVSAADVRHAPPFAEIAGTLAALLAGRVFVAHNVNFDMRFVVAEFASLGYDVPLAPPTCLCTMRLAGALLPDAPRTLAGCCHTAGIPLTNAHAALADAEAAAGLLQHYLSVGAGSGDLPWISPLELAETATWPSIPVNPVTPVLRGAAADRDTHFLARLTDSLPSVAGPEEHTEYLALLDRALLDRYLSAREHDALAAAARSLGISRTTAAQLHHRYLADLALVARADGVVTDDERADLLAVATLLGLTGADVACALATGVESPPDNRARFALRRGDLVVFTGEMSVPRNTWCARAAAAGLVPHPSVTKKVALVVAADPDSLSGKARKAADYGVPIVGEQAFARILAALN